jgi:hypothetical protein
MREAKIKKGGLKFSMHQLKTGWCIVKGQFGDTQNYHHAKTVDVASALQKVFLLSNSKEPLNENDLAWEAYKRCDLKCPKSDECYRTRGVDSESEMLTECRDFEFLDDFKVNRGKK